MFEEAGRRRRQGWEGPGRIGERVQPVRHAESSSSMSTQQSDDDIQQEALKAAAVLSDQEMLKRARAAHNREDFDSCRLVRRRTDPGSVWKESTASSSSGDQ